MNEQLKGETAKPTYEPQLWRVYPPQGQVDDGEIDGNRASLTSKQQREALKW